MKNLELKYCECGCGRVVKPGNRYIYGHNRKGRLYVAREIRVCPICGGSFKCRVTATQKYCGIFCQLKVVHKYMRRPCPKVAREKISDSISKGYLKGRCGTGYNDGWVSTRLGEKVYCRSSYEKKAVDILNSFEDVLTIKTEALRIPYKMKGIRRYYLPDILVSITNGTLYLIEVKPKGQLEEERNQVKFASAIRYAVEHNMVFLIWTEDILFSNKNGSTTVSLQEIVEATAATLVSDKVMIQSELYGNIER